MTHEPSDGTSPNTPRPATGFGRAPDAVDAAIERHSAAREDLQRAAHAVDAAGRASRQVEAEADAAFTAAGQADGAAWADLLATRPTDVPGAVRLLRYVSVSPASEIVEDPQDLLRQLTEAVAAAETGGQAVRSSAEAPVSDAGPDPTLAVTAEFRRVWDAANAAARSADDGDVPEDHLRAVDEASAALRAVRPTTPAGFRALASTWAYRLGGDLREDTAAAHAAASLIAGAGVCVPPSAGPDPIEAAITAHLAARDAFTATVDAQDVDWVREHGGDTSDAAMAPAKAAWRAADQVEVAAWNALFDVAPVTPRGAAALIRHVAKWGPEQDGHEDAINLTDGLSAIADGLAGMAGTTPDAASVDWHAPPAGFMASPAIEPFGFALIPEGIAIELGRLRGIALAEFERCVEAGVTGEAKERLRRALHLDALSMAARGEGRFDIPLSAPRDWQAEAARHPGFVPYPARAPSALVALDLAIQGEASRLLTMAEAEVERRRQDYAGYRDPQVWPRVERCLRREMRMDALAAVARDLHDGDDPDPVLAAIAASRAAEAEMAAFGEEATTPLTPEIRAREDALCEVQRTTRVTAWETVPTTHAGRVALVDYARFQIEAHRAPDGEVDSAEDLLGEILGALEAAIRGERPEMASAPSADPVGGDPSNLDALALVSAIEAEWTAQARVGDDARPAADDETDYARRSALLSAADELPADTRAARHAKALALAWIVYADLWQPGRSRDSYATNGRLALDINGAFRTSITTEHPDAALFALGPTIAALITARDAVPADHEEAYAKIDGLVLDEGRRLAAMPARTLAGLILKARFVERGADEELKDAIVADLLALGGGE